MKDKHFFKIVIALMILAIFFICYEIIKKVKVEDDKGGGEVTVNVEEDKEKGGFKEDDTEDYLYFITGQVLDVITKEPIVSVDITATGGGIGLSGGSGLFGILPRTCNDCVVTAQDRDNKYKKYTTPQFTLTDHTALMNPTPPPEPPIELCPLIRIVRSPTVPTRDYHPSIQIAYDNASNSETITVIETTDLQTKFHDDLMLDEDKSVTITGGYNCDHTAVSGKTIVIGTLSQITHGTSTISHIEFQ